jgi:hypothetical protein
MFQRFGLPNPLKRIAANGSYKIFYLLKNTAKKYGGRLLINHSQNAAKASLVNEMFMLQSAQGSWPAGVSRFIFSQCPASGAGGSLRI